eukprot:CAMPEP_0181244702 /NCGR_PEP_ID=MMETSP1096-20121128/43008_1 /TAXON_ID=156174 ORGANISM="Chrysochromulina ericina, Strain CCMP281" /NCGR_SAMPLE_ID=MMETSP1096 /ASSEMBLY_ACC=CAM_ASM_000453 /LENGTH=45 /DNA_ID= /DNA_START= /DNA_END= /DNA_ORIENTATION=
MAGNTHRMRGKRAEVRGASPSRSPPRSSPTSLHNPQFHMSCPAQS